MQNPHRRSLWHAVTSISAGSQAYLASWAVLLIAAGTRIAIPSRILTTVVLIATIYLPRSPDPINGGPLAANGVVLQTGHAACGPAYPFGTRFHINTDLSAWGLPQEVVCIDRGSLITNRNLDIALVSDDLQADYARASSFGLRIISATIELPPPSPVMTGVVAYRGRLVVGHPKTPSNAKPD